MDPLIQSAPKELCHTGLGHRPGIQMVAGKALKARFNGGRTDSRFQRWSLVNSKSWDDAPGLR
jgi:hypothetical protein